MQEDENRQLYQRVTNSGINSFSSIFALLWYILLQKNMTIVYRRLKNRDYEYVWDKWCDNVE